MNWFSSSRPASKSYIIEVEKASSPPETPETIASVESLRGHGGFQWLLKKLRYQRARLQAELNGTRHEDLRAVDFLQSGMFWCNWLQQQLDFAHERYSATREALPTEDKFFEQIAAQLEYVGRTQDSQ